MDIVKSSKSAEIKEMQNQVVSGLGIFADAIGAENSAKRDTYGFVPGIGLKAEEKILLEKCEEIKQGVFNVLFTGTFSGGKSTLINAVIGKHLLPESPNAETPTISKIWFGRSSEKVTVVYSSDTERAKLAGKKPGEREIITVSDYQEKMRLKNGIEVENIDHVEIEQKEDVFENLAQFVDSPGLDNAVKENQVTQQYESKANAVVFLINATKPLGESERIRIAAKYYKKNLKNIFFVVTRMDCLNGTEEVEEVKERTYEILRDVFVDEQGCFDEALCRKRVFFVNALGAECVRTGRPFRVGNYEIPIKIDETGLPEFEVALSEFLLSDEKYQEAYYAELPTMRNYFQSFKAETEKRLQLIKDGVAAANEKKKIKEAEIAKINGTIQNIQDTCENLVKEISLSVSQQYMNFTNNVRASWDEYFEDKAHYENIKFGVTEAAKLAWYNMENKFKKDDLKYDAKVQALTKPLTDAILQQDADGNILGGYVGQKLNEFKADLSKDIEIKIVKKGGIQERLEKYCGELENFMEDADINMESILQEVYALLGQSNVDIGTNGGSLTQALIALVICGDTDTAITSMDNKLSTGDFIKRLILKTCVEDITILILSALTGAGFLYYIVKVIYEFFNVKRTSNKLAKEALCGAKDAICEQLEEQNANVTASVSETFRYNLEKGLGDVFGHLEGSLQDEIDNLEKIIGDMENNRIHGVSEKERFEKIEQIMVRAYNQVSLAICGKTYDSAAEIMAL